MSEKLNLILRKIIREEIRTELSIFKTEILTEIRNGLGQLPLVEDAKPQPVTRITNAQNRSIKSSSGPKIKYSNDPFLQSLLEETIPANHSDRSPYLDIMLDTDDIVEPAATRTQTRSSAPTIATKTIPIKAPIVTEDITGSPINRVNPTVRRVLDIMNMDFSSTLKTMEAAAKDARPKF
jgi:hypothetical protein